MTSEPADRGVAVAAAVAAATTLLHALFSWQQWTALIVPSWDLGIFAQLAKAYSRFEAPITMTFSRPSTPSISLRSCGTIVFSTSLDTPDPRVLNSESISSKKTITGIPSLAFSRAR